MTALQEFLRARREADVLSTEDTLACFLPLARQVLEAHENGRVAPLRGLDDLQVEGACIWFENARRMEVKINEQLIRSLDPPPQGIEIVDQSERVVDAELGIVTSRSRLIGSTELPLEAPMYLPGHVAWEHQVEHHDPLTDVFSLGMILVSLACCLDFSDEQQLVRFVEHRRNPFALNQELHPLVAQLIIRMTELSRHRRAQDLAAIIRSLENYREQVVEFDVELAQIQGFYSKDLETKQQLVLAKLQKRLFETSRRNRLLHFRPTMNTINLTQASVPLSCAPETIELDQLLTWNDSVQDKVIAGKEISLTQRININEALYVPGVLDRIAAETRRNQAEFGFTQLRLVACFLRWTNLRESTQERYESPLLLLPVQLKKKKGIRDSYSVRPLSSEAEVNPVVRFQFQQLYELDLPERIDLAETSIETFYQFLVSRVQSSEPAVTLEKVDRPRMKVVYEQARRRLDQYRRRAKVAGRGVRTYDEIDYSYDPANYHPLGIRLFHQKIANPEASLRAPVDGPPPPAAMMRPTGAPASQETSRHYVHIHSQEELNPYTWEFDLCQLTLGNFHYRKASLVRDYTELVEQPRENPAFDATFSLVPLPPGESKAIVPSLTARYDVVPCDPTQAKAIAQSRTGESYIIQGPPGTGKSQTITNLIADYVARGRRVLFVCEKRAAIDVVYLRLKQQGLQQLCCLIHDSQADKKEFVMDLKAAYEGMLDQPEEGRVAQERDAILQKVERALGPLQAFQDAMMGTPVQIGMRLREFLSRNLEIAEQAPQLSPVEQERLPDYAAWECHREALERLELVVRDVQPDGILANHPLRWLGTGLVEQERPIELVTQKLTQGEAALANLIRVIRASHLDTSHCKTLQAVQRVVDYASQVAPLTRLNQLGLVDEESAAAADFLEDEREWSDRRDRLAQAREATKHWREKLPRDEARSALEQSRLLENDWLAVLQPRWWRLRSVLQRHYDFRQHTVPPNWPQVLEWLLREYEAAENVRWCEDNWRMKLGFEGDPATFRGQVMDLRENLNQLPDVLVDVHRQLLAEDNQHPLVDAILDARQPLQDTLRHLDAILTDYHAEELETLLEQLQLMQQALGDLPEYMLCLRELATVPDELASTLRRSTLRLEQVEAAMAARSLTEVLRGDRAVGRFTPDVRQRHVDQLSQLYQDWQHSNARGIFEKVSTRFQENVRIASLPTSQLQSEQAAFKKVYNRGRRELEHEFGKQMRYKSIRDLVSGESGEVVKDLKPVWLMSPLSVSDALPLDTDHFDVVIFDEASQITLEEAVPSLYRATQAIVVGDEMQLPPTAFFASKETDEEALVLPGEDEEQVHYDLSTNSFLNHAARNLSSHMLGWHYRSRSESLISFSNWAFYRGQLLTVPEEKLVNAGQSEIRVIESGDGADGAKAILERALSFHHLEHGVYQKRRNRAEAEYIAEMVRALLLSEDQVSLGIVAFSEAQQDEIESALQRLAGQDPEFQARLDAEYEREQEGQYVGLIVKNLENIQGDERDVIILSVCYGPDSDGRMRMNFGPINQAGGEKRLNVAFSRAKHHMAIVSTIQPAQITNEYNDGARCLKNYLRYVSAASVGDQAAMQQVLLEMSPWSGAKQGAVAVEDEIVRRIGCAIEQRGFLVDYHVGQSSLRCHLAVRCQGDTEYRLGILVDTEEFYQQMEPLEREMMKPKLLEAFGWSVMHVTAKDWCQDPEQVLERICQILSEARS